MAVETTPHNYFDLISLFERTFFETYNVRLIRGDDEPVYQPADQSIPFNRVVFAHGFYASAFHEIAHWCFAGSARHDKTDFGYWYVGDGRDEEQQKIFEQVEVKPQAIEWAFCVAAGFPFNVSCDNLDGAEPDYQAFRNKVAAQVSRWVAEGFPPRAEQFIKALADFYGTPYPLTIKQFGQVS